MAISAKILGDHVGSTAPVFLAFLAVHIAAALTAVISGAAAGLTRRAAGVTSGADGSSTERSPWCS